MPETASPFAGDRLAKVIARAGLCSRRDAEGWIRDGRVAVNGKIIRTPAFNVSGKDEVRVDGRPLSAREGTRVWLYHKPAGLVVTEKDPEGRATIFGQLAQQGLPRVVTVGRLDINTEGLLLLTNDGGLKRVLELPATGWLRRYRVRAFGTVTQAQLHELRNGIEVEGIRYGPIEASVEREQGSNVWLDVALREGKNREVKNVLAALGLEVNRLIRVSFGPFQLGELPPGSVEVVRARVLRDQLGKRLAEQAQVDFDSDLPEPAARRQARGTDPNARVAAPGKPAPRQRRRDGARRPDASAPPRGPRSPRREDRGDYAPRPVGRPRRVFHEDGTETEFVPKTYGRKPRTAETGDRTKRPFARAPGFAASRGDAETTSGARDRRSAAAPRGRGTRKDGDGTGRRRDFGERPQRAAGKPPAGGNRRAAPAPRGTDTRADRAGRTTARAPGRGGKPFGAADRPRGSGPKPGPRPPRGAGPQGKPPRRPRPPRT